MGAASPQTLQKCMGQGFREAILSAGDTWKCPTQITGAYPLAVKKYKLSYSWLLIILFCPKLRYTVRRIRKNHTDSVQINFQAGFQGTAVKSGLCYKSLCCVACCGCSWMLQFPTCNMGLMAVSQQALQQTVRLDLSCKLRCLETFAQYMLKSADLYCLEFLCSIKQICNE